MIDVEQQRETAASLIMAGWMACLFDALVLFFLPAAVRLGYQVTFLVIMGALLAAGFVLIVSGYSIRRKSLKA
jgi:hypothetical protein